MLVVFSIFNIAFIAMLSFNLFVKIKNIRQGKFVFQIGIMRYILPIISVMSIFLVSMLLIILNLMGVFEGTTLNFINIFLLVISVIYLADRLYKDSKLMDYKQFICLASLKTFNEEIKSQILSKGGRYFYKGENIDEFLKICNDITVDKKYLKKQILLSILSIVGVFILFISGFILPNMV